MVVVGKPFLVTSMVVISAGFRVGIGSGVVAGALPLLRLAERDEGEDGQDDEGPEGGERFLVHSF